MSIEHIITLVVASLAFVASLIAAAVSIYNARFRRFALERWWERKAEAYTHIIEALVDMVSHYEQVYDAEFSRRELPDDRKAEIDELGKRGYREVARAAHIGAFIISRDAEASLKRFREGPDEKRHQADWFGGLEASYIAAEQCLKELVECAKKDLRVPR